MKKFIAKLCIMFTILVFTNSLFKFMMFNDINSYTRLTLKEMYDYSGNIDTVFIGSSHVYRSYDPKIADDLLHTNSYNAGTSAQMLDGSFYLLKEIIKYNNVKTVYLDTYFGIAQKESSADMSTYVISDYMKPSLNKYEFLWEYGGMNALMNNFVPIRHNISFNITKLVKEKLKDGYAMGNYKYVTYPNEEYRGKGFVYSFEIANDTTDFSPPSMINKDKVLSNQASKYLERITTLCRETNINLILVSSPMPDAMLSQVDNYQIYIDYLGKYAETNNIYYWDFSLCKKNLLTMDIKDFKDSNHLNGFGAEKCTKALCYVTNEIINKNKISTDFFYDTYADKILNNPDSTLNR